MNRDIKVSEIFEWVLNDLNLNYLKYDHQFQDKFIYSFDYPLIDEYDTYKESISKYLPLIVFHIPNENIFNVFETQKMVNKYIFSIIYTIIRTLNINDNFEIVIAYSLYCILHEVGHFYHFKNFTSKNDYSIFLQKSSKIREQIITDRKKKDLSEEENMQYEIRYMTMCGEVEANKYALLNIGNVFAKYKIENSEYF